MSIVRAIWLDWLTGGGYVDIDDPAYLRVAVINIIGGLGCVVWTIMLVRNTLLLSETGNLMRVLVDGFGVVISIAMLAAIRLRMPVDATARCANIAMLVSVLGVINVRADPAYSLMAAAVYPPLAFLLLDRVRNGAFWSLTAVAFLDLMVVLQLGPWDAGGRARVDAVLTITITMVTLTSTMAAYVHSRWRVFERLDRMRAELAQQAIRDPLTGFYNRRSFTEALEQCLARASRDPNGLAVVMLDLDHFKAYNDAEGHPAGDRVLATMAAVLRETFTRGDDQLFRLGGEEFCVAFFTQDLAKAEHLTRRAMDGIRALEIPSPGGPKRYFTASAGLLWVPDGGQADADTLYALADEALYRAKEAGRDRYLIADSATAFASEAVIAR